MKLIKNLLAIIKYRLFSNNIVSIGVKLNSNTKLEGKNKLFKKSTVYNSKIGFGSYIGESSMLSNTMVGRYSSIGPRVRVVGGRHPAKDFVSTHPAFYSLRKQAGFTYVESQMFEEFKKLDSGFSVEIGNDVWIGSDVIILEGVKIGNGVIIGAGSVVSKDLEDYSIYVGNPIQFIRKRFSDEEISKLLKLKWWDKSEDWIKSNIQKFTDISKL